MSDGIPGSARCAILLYSLGMDQASSLLKRMDPEEAGQIASAARRLKDVDAGLVADVLSRFHQLMAGNQLLPGEGASFIESALERAGAEVPEEQSDDDPGLCPDADPESLGKLLRNEHPQTLAVVLASIDPARGVAVLQKLPEEKRSEVVRRLASLQTVPTHILRQIESTVRGQLRRRSTEPIRQIQGPESAAGILKLVDKETSQSILEAIAQEDGALSDQVRQRMFIFDDLANMDDRGIRNLLKEIDSQVLAKALKVAEEGVRTKFFKNMSERAAVMLEEDVDALPPMRLSEVEEAQQVIVDAAAGLILEGKAVMAGGAGGEAIV